MRALSLFTGIGGFDLGLSRAGVSVVGMAEKDPQCRELLQDKFADAFIWDDVRSMNGAEVEKRIGPVDVIAFGWPCQDHSMAGPRSGMAGKRSGLFREAHRLIEEIRPRWILAENVPGLLSVQGGQGMDEVTGALGESGYALGWRVLDAQYFGVPQRRRRVFFVGHSGGPGPVSKVLFEPESLRWDSQKKQKARQAAPPRSGGGPGGSRIQPSVDVAYCLSTRQERLHREETFVNHAGAVRRLTPLECERLQGFPDGWTGGFRDGTRYRMVGNAVAVPVAEWIGQRMMEVENAEG